MNKRLFAVALIAVVAGFVGGWASRFLPTGTRYAPIRATRIELVDGSGKTRAFIGTDSTQDTALVFLDEKQRQRAKFGLWPRSYTPKLVMWGADGKERVGFHLSYVDDRPVILLSDHARTRVHLGFYQNDAPSRLDEDWAIRFYAPDDYQKTLAATGMRRDWNDNKMHGFVVARAKDDQMWSEPKK